MKVIQDYWEYFNGGCNLQPPCSVPYSALGIGLDLTSSTANKQVLSVVIALVIAKSRKAIKTRFSDVFSTFCSEINALCLSRFRCFRPLLSPCGSACGSSPKTLRKNCAAGIKDYRKLKASAFQYLNPFLASATHHRSNLSSDP